MDLLTAAVYEVIDNVPNLRLEFSNGSKYYLDTLTQKEVFTDNGFIFVSELLITQNNVPIVFQTADVEMQTQEGTISARLTYSDDPRLIELFKRFVEDIANDRFTVGLNIYTK